MWIPNWLPKFSVLAAQKEKHETEIMLLKAEHQKDKEKLQTENQNLRLEIDRLKQKPPERAHLKDLPEIQERILSFIARNEDRDVGPDTSEIAHRVSVAREAIQFHLHELELLDYIESSDRGYGIVMWFMKHEGRRYLIERGLIK